MAEIEKESTDAQVQRPWVQRWAGLLSVASIPAMLLMFRAVLHSMHLHFEERLAYPRLTDDGDEVTSEISVAGWYVLIITLMIARRLYWIFAAGGFKHHMERDAALMWNTWFIGLTVGTVFVYAFDAVLPRHMPGRGLVFPLIAVAVGFVCYRVYEAIRGAPSG